jgi:hypothetical protein
MKRGMTVDEPTICDDCIYGEKKSEEIPCNSCMQWVNGYIEATKFRPTRTTINQIRRVAGDLMGEDKKDG